MAALYRPLHQALREKILAKADHCAADRSALDDYAAVSPGGRPAAVLFAKPAFVELVRDFAASFGALTEAVDRAVITGCPWRDLIADRLVLAGLDAGLAAEQRLILARAARLFLAHEHADYSDAAEALRPPQDAHSASLAATGKALVDLG